MVYVVRRFFVRGGGRWLYSQVRGRKYGWVQSVDAATRFDDLLEAMGVARQTPGRAGEVLYVVLDHTGGVSKEVRVWPMVDVVSAVGELLPDDPT